MNTFDEFGHLYKIDGVVIPSVSQILQANGLSDFSMVKPDILERAKQFGLGVHKGCELHDLKTLDRDSLCDPLVPYITQWQRFLTTFKVQILDIERRFWSTKYRFGGCLDRVAIINSKLTDVEIKTTTSISPTTAIQTMGYKILYDEGRKFKDKIKKRLVVQLKEKSFEIKEYRDARDEQIFMSCLTVLNYKKGRGIIK